jgi:hypothetical protein
MSGSLIELLRTNPALLDGKSSLQVIQFAGEGRLRDGNETSREVREWMSAIPLVRAKFGIDTSTSSIMETGSS